MAGTTESCRRHSDDYYFGPSPPSSVFYSATFKSCCCCLLLLLTFLLLLAVAVFLLLFLLFKPHNPTFDLDRVDVHRLAVTSVAAGAPPAYHVSLNLTLIFAAENPNKVEIRYDPARLKVTCRGAPLREVAAALPGFAQPAHSRRMVESVVAGEGFNVTPADGGDMHDYVELRVTGDVRAKIRAVGVTSRLQARVQCVMKISPRNQDLIQKECGGLTITK